MKKRTKKELAVDCVHYLDQNSSNVLDKGNNPFNQWVEMEDSFGTLKIWFRCQQSPYSNGYSAVKVWNNGKLVLSAKGNGFLWMESVSKFADGSWTKRIPRHGN